MQSNESSNHPLSLVVVGLSLGVMSLTLTLTCTWMTNRKRRVGVHVSSKHRSLDMEGPPSRTRCSTVSGPPRYTKRHELSINHLITHPSIIITPPTPLALLSNSPFLQSDSSIGSAEDLLDDENNENNENEANADSDGCADSLNENRIRNEKKILKEIRITKLKSEFGFTDMRAYDHRLSPRKLQLGNKPESPVSSNIINNSSKPMYSSSPEIASCTEVTSSARSGKVSESRTVIADESKKRGNESDTNSGIVDIDTNDMDDSFETTPCSPRPRLYSMNPGTKKSDLVILSVEAHS